MRMRFSWRVVGIAAVALVAVPALFLAWGPPYADGQVWRLTPTTLLAPLRSYLFRNAVTNTVWLALAATVAVLPLAWLWAYWGISRREQPYMLLPMLLPGALAGLLWRPLLEPWLVLAHAEIALASTGLVIVWQALPASALILAWKRRAWTLAALPPLWLALSDAGLVMTLTRGEPFNAAHTWASWALVNGWVMRGWGLAAAMSLGLAAVIAAMTAVLVRMRPPAAQAAGYATTPPEGGLVTALARGGRWLLVLAWVGLPFGPALLDVMGAPGRAVAGWWMAGGIGRLFHWLVTMGGVGGVSYLLTRSRPATPPHTMSVALLAAAWVLWPSTLTLLRDLLPGLLPPWLLLPPLVITVTVLLAWLPAPTTLRFSFGLSVLLLAQAFALEVALGFTPGHALPTLGTVMTLAEGDTPARSLALLVHGGLALVGAWMIRAVVESQGTMRTYRTC